MKTINLEQVPAQSLTFVVNDVSYQVRIFDISENGEPVMCADVSINGQGVLNGFRIEKGSLIIPFQYLSEQGNLLLSMPDEEDADYNRFGESQILYYLSPTEALEFLE